MPHPAPFVRTPAVVLLLAALALGGCGGSAPATGPRAEPVVFPEPSCGPDGTVYETLAELERSGAEVAPPVLRGGIVALHGRIRYPEAARKARAQGQTVVRFVVGRDGRPARPEIVATPHPSLGAEVLRVLHGAAFEPATVDGEPVCVRMSMPVNVRLGATRYID